MTRYFGCHVSTAGGLENGIANGKELGVNAIQVHPAPPQRWNSKPFADGYEDAFIEARKDSGIDKVFFHAIYLINLATPDDRKFKLGQLSLQNHLDLMARIGGDGVVFHVGSMKDQPDEKAGLQRAIDGINTLLEKSENDARLILEVSAGSGKIIGAKMEELATIFDGIKQQERVGFGLDSQHMWASGYDFQNGLDSIMSALKKHFGVEKTWIVHLNDSMTDLASNKDRHANIGEGKIGEKALKAFMNHKDLRDIPFVLETPALKSMESAAVEVKNVQGMIA